MRRAFALIVLAAAPVFAQTATGLDALDDDRLMNELAARGLTNLLDRAFEVNKIPEADRAGRRTILALKQLASTADQSKLTPAQKQLLVGKAVAGVKAALPNLKDPEMMLQGAYVLESQGAEDLIKTLEYWGDDTTAMAQLRPIADAAVALYARASELATEQASTLANQITAVNSPQVAKVERLEQLASTSAYRKAMTTYALVMSMDRADAKRTPAAIEAITALKDQDIAENPNRGEPRLRIGKLQLYIGAFNDARKTLDSLANADKSLGVEITPAQQYEAKYFRAVADVLDKKPADGQKLLDALIAWQKSTLPGDKPTQDGVAAAAAMLQFRVFDAQGDVARDSVAKDDAKGKAVATLNQLLRDQPALLPIINRLLVARLGENVDFKTLDPLLLGALVRRGEAEAMKPAEQAGDEKALKQGVEAARQLIERKGQPGIDPAGVQDAAIVLGFMLQKQNQPAPAVGALLDFCQQYPTDERAAMAIDNAGGILGGLYKDNATDAAVADLYDRFLAISVNQFKRTELAYTLGRRLQSTNKPVDAITAFRKVPDNDKRLLNARFFEMVALKQVIDAGKLSTDEKAVTLSAIQTLADKVNAMAGTSTTPEAKALQIRTLLLAADLSRTESNDPARALALLEGFEAKAKGMAGEGDLLAEALQIRVQALIAQDKNEEAGNELVKLQQQSPARGREIVFQLLTRLNDEFDKASSEANVERQRSLAGTRAKLAELLLGQVKSSDNPEVKKLAYTYTAFSARTKRDAAMLQADEAQKKTLLDESRALYDSLDNAAQFAEFKQSLPEERREKFRYDPSVRLGIGLVAFDQGDFDKSSRRLGELLNDKILGTPKRTIQQAGQDVEIDNEQYWEAVYKLIKANVQLSANVDGQKNFLKQQFILAGKNAGGKKWAAAFEALRKELIPEYEVPELSATATTQPG